MDSFKTGRGESDNEKILAFFVKENRMRQKSSWR